MQRRVPPDRLHDLGPADEGLTGAEVAARRTRYGANAIVPEAESGWLAVLRGTAFDPMVWFLAALSALYFWLGDITEGAVLLLALLPIIGMDAYLHRRTQASTEGLAGRLATRAQALRDGQLREVAAADLVPGDLVVVPAGGYFPADGLILSGEGLQADESALSGEALPVRKTPCAVLPPGAGASPLAEAHWGMAGTRLLAGQARLRVVFTGADTLYGEIARLSLATHAERTPLQDAIARLVQALLAAALVLCLMLGLVRLWQGYGLLDAVVSAVTLALAALPEEFPVVFSFFLGVGVYRLARRQALVRRAVVVENIGRITCLCTDKTGTLTEGRLALGEAIAAEGLDRGGLLAVAATAARAETGDPIDLLLLDAAQPLEGAQLALFPFTEDRRREVAVLRDPEGRVRVAVKGAPETVLAMAGLAPEEVEAWRRETLRLAAAGQKVIAVATAVLGDWGGEEPAQGLSVAGLVGFVDPLRPGVAEAVREAQDAGIRVIMLTGDHARTAEAIAGQIGMGSAVIEGAEMARRLASGLGTAGIDVVARCTPAQKLALVQALRHEGEIVGVTGDGVNDAPALRGADVGIAMGARGTRSAREVAAIVLLDDDFATIIRAIAEGRQLFVNLRLSFAFLLMAHVPLVATATLIPLMGFPLLYLPVHIVWAELIMHPTALLVFQQLPAAPRLAPVVRRESARIFRRREWLAIALVGLVATAVIALGYIYNLAEGAEAQHARSMAVAALFIGYAAVTAALSGLRSRQALIGVLATVASVVAAVQLPPLAAALHLGPLHAVDWAIATAGGVVAGAAAMLVHRRAPA